MTPPFFHRLRLLVDLEIDRVEITLKRLAAADYPTAAPPKFIAELLKELAKQKEAVHSIVSAYTTDARGSFQRLQSEHRKLLLHLPYLTSLENAQTSRVPWSLVSSFEQLAKALMPGRQLLTTCASDFNYAITWRLNRAAGGGLEEFDLLELPAVHKGNAFLHVLVGHELFHPILAEFFAIEQPVVYANLRGPCQQILQSQQNQPSLFDSRRLDEMVEAAVRIWRRAVEELMCDMGCCVLFGPAAVLAMSMLMMPSNLDQTPVAPSLYPPHRYRLRVAFTYSFDRDEGSKAVAVLVQMLSGDTTSAEFKTLGAELNEQMEFLRALTTDYADVKRLSALPLLKIAYDEVSRVLDSAWDFVRRKVEAANLLPWHDLKVIAEIQPHLHSLLMSVPCGEVRGTGRQKIGGAPSNVSAVFVAAWLHELSREKSQITDVADRPLDSYLDRCRLLLKSVEDSELKRQFLIRKSKQQPAL